ncbi:lysylphosphatidylglycerol synthase transmembrane domain-containing protein [Methanosarcina barkeri]|nr:lysylphosphatidylglycerol synthase transmembrane domain-containing protein [Methanosarcina barkeri]
MAKNKIWMIVLFTIIVYIIMGVYADVGKLSLTISEFRWQYFLLLIGLTTVGYFIRYIKWDLFLRATGLHLDYKENLFIFFSGLSMIVTPGKLGEIWKSWLIKDISGEELSKTLPIVIMDRVTDIVSLVLLSFLGIFYYRKGISFLIVLSICCIGFYIAIRSQSISGKMKKVLEKKFSKYTTDMQLMHETMNKITEPKIFVSLSLLNVLAWFFECMGLYYVVIGFGHYIKISLSTFIFSFSSLAGGISMVPGGIGVAEAGISGLLILNGISPALSVGIALILRLGSFWYGALLGFTVHVIFKKKFMRAKENLGNGVKNV